MKGVLEAQFSVGCSLCKIIFTLAPNSTRFAKFCTDLATSVSVLAAVGEGESGRNAK